MFKKIIFILCFIFLFSNSIFALDLKNSFFTKEKNNTIRSLKKLSEVIGHKNMTRYEIAKIIYIIKKPKGNYREFADVESWRYEVRLLGGAGIFNGYPDGTFKPNNMVTLEELNWITKRCFPNETFYSNKGNDFINELVTIIEK